MCFYLIKKISAPAFGQQHQIDCSVPPLGWIFVISQTLELLSIRTAPLMAISFTQFCRS